MSTRKNWSRWAVALIAGIVVATGLGFWQLAVKSGPAPLSIADDDHAREQVTEFVADNVVKMLSFTPTTNRGDIDAVAELLTGQAAEDYRKSMRSRAEGVTQNASVRNTGVEALSADEAQVVAFVDQTAKPANGPSTNDALAYRVSLTRVDGDWLISELEPL